VNDRDLVMQMVAVSKLCVNERFICVFELALLLVPRILSFERFVFYPFRLFGKNISLCGF
jgi:hypothetical protein